MNRTAARESMCLRIARTDAGLFVHLQGIATHQVCQAVDRVVGAYRRARPHELLVTIDCETCRWIDSTLAGWLLEHASAMRAASGGLCLANCSREFRESLRRLHIEERFEYCQSKMPSDSKLVRFSAGLDFTDALLRQMLRAHQTLMKVHRENALLLAPVVAAIQLELGKRQQQSLAISAA